MKEKQLVKKVVDYLNSLPETFAFRNEQRPGMSRGASDVFCCRAGRMICIECKIHPNKPTPLQERFLRQVREAGGTALVIYSIEQLEKEWI